MKILGIESSGLVASVAVVEDDVLKAEFTVNNKLTHSQTLLPMLKNMLEILGAGADDMDAIAVSAGPGSFTGLRIGAATAKGLALAADKPIVKVSTLEALYKNINAESGDVIVCPIMDARRGQVYCAAWKNGEKIIEEKACPLTELLEELKKFKGRIVFTGDAVPVCKNIIETEAGLCSSFAEAQNNRQRAASVASCGLKKYSDWLKAQGTDPETAREKGADALSAYDDTVMNSDDFAPEYLRKPQAEREKDAGLLEDPGSRSLRKVAKGELERRRES